MEEQLDNILPGVTQHAFNLKYYNDLYRSPTTDDVDDFEFITTQMLEIALCLDYADEVGRRKMFELLRDILRTCELNEEHLSKIVKIFRMISLDERDFTRTIIEIISDIQEQLNPFDDFFVEDEEAPAPKRSRIDENEDSVAVGRAGSVLDEENSLMEGGDGSMEQPDPQAVMSMVIKLRCLGICRHMLEHVQQVSVYNKKPL